LSINHGAVSGKGMMLMAQPEHLYAQRADRQRLGAGDLD
jgi:hypothetical protein